MKKTFFSLVTAALMALSLNAQDKVTKTVLELGRTDNRTMEHADYIARNIGGRIVGSHMLHHAEEGLDCLERTHCFMRRYWSC